MSQELAQKMQVFMKGKAKPVEPQKFIITKRYTDEKGNPVPIEMMPIPQAKIEQLRKDCREIDGKGEEKFNTERFNALFAIESTVFPPLKDPELLSSYGMFDPVDLAKEIFKLGGEYANWIAAANKVNGYDEDFQELKEQAKN